MSNNPPGNIYSRYKPSLLYNPEDRNLISNFQDRLQNLDLYARDNRLPSLEFDSEASEYYLKFSNSVVGNRNVSISPPFSLLFTFRPLEQENFPFHENPTLIIGDFEGPHLSISQSRRGTNIEAKITSEKGKEEVLSHSPSLGRIDSYIAVFKEGSVDIHTNERKESFDFSGSLDNFQIGGDYFKGDLFEALLYNRELDQNEIESGRTYFSQEYGFSLIPPLAEAGEDIEVDSAPQRVVLDGSDSESSVEGGVTHEWEVVKPENVTPNFYEKSTRTSTNKAEKVVFELPEQENYSIRLTVTDINGSTDTDYVTVNSDLSSTLIQSVEKDFDRLISNVRAKSSVNLQGESNYGRINAQRLKGPSSGSTYLFESSLTSRLVEDDLITVQYELAPTQEPDLERDIFEISSDRTTFTFSQSFEAGTERVFYNGLLLEEGQNKDYEIVSSDQIEFNDTAKSGNVVEALYETSPTSETEEVFTLDTNPSYSFQLNSVPSSETQRVYLNSGFLVPNIDYTVSSDTININSSEVTLTGGNQIEVFYETNVTNREYIVKNISNPSSFDRITIQSDDVVEGTERVYWGNMLISRGVEYKIQF